MASAANARPRECLVRILRLLADGSARTENNERGNRRQRPAIRRRVNIQSSLYEGVRQWQKSPANLPEKPNQQAEKDPQPERKRQREDGQRPPQRRARGPLRRQRSSLISKVSWRRRDACSRAFPMATTTGDPTRSRDHSASSRRISPSSLVSR